MSRTFTTSRIYLGLLGILVVYYYSTSVKDCSNDGTVSEETAVSFIPTKVKTTTGTHRKAILKSMNNTMLKTNNVTKSIEQSKLSKINNVELKTRTKYLIYLCDSQLFCGGFGDRQRGITGSFMIAIQLNRTFGIIMSTPCDVRQFFIPNKYNWIIPESELIGKPSKIIDNMYKPFQDLSNDTTEVIYLKTDFGADFWIYRRIRHKLPPYLKGGTTRGHIFKLIWESLMKPSRHLINHLKMLSLPKNMTCAHVRIGKSKNLSNDPARNNLTNVQKLWKFMETLDKANAIFVATDNNEVRISARQRFSKRFFDSGGTILHMDRQRGVDADCLGFETSILDFIILSRCKILIISYSGFSTRAAMLRGISKDLYMFRGADIKPFELIR